LIQAQGRAERDRVTKQAQRVPHRAYLDGEQLAACRSGAVDLVDHRQRAGQPVGDEHPLVPGYQHGADPGAGREQGAQPGGGLVVAQPGRHHRDEGSRRRGALIRLLREGKRRPDEGAGAPRGGDARR
jgi:hypothetical protein